MSHIFDEYEKEFLEFTASISRNTSALPNLDGGADSPHVPRGSLPAEPRDKDPVAREAQRVQSRARQAQARERGGGEGGERGGGPVAAPRLRVPGRRERADEHEPARSHASGDGAAGPDRGPHPGG